MADGGEDFRSVCHSTDEPLLQTMSPSEGHEVDDHPWDPHPTYMDEPLGLTASIRSQGKGKLDSYQLWGMHKRKREIQKAHLDHWEGTVSRTGTGRPVDAILCPVAPFAAPPHGLNRYVPLIPATLVFFFAFWSDHSMWLLLPVTTFTQVCSIS